MALRSIDWPALLNAASKSMVPTEPNSLLPAPALASILISNLPIALLVFVHLQ
jgi:hypothetical protein